MWVHGLQPVAVLFECNLYCSMLVCNSIQYNCNTNITQGYYYYFYCKIRLGFTIIVIYSSPNTNLDATFAITMFRLRLIWIFAVFVVCSYCRKDFESIGHHRWRDMCKELKFDKHHIDFIVRKLSTIIIRST